MRKVKRRCALQGTQLETNCDDYPYVGYQVSTSILKEKFID